MISRNPGKLFLVKRMENKITITEKMYTGPVNRMFYRV